MHVHVIGANGEAKFWLEPTIGIAKNHRLTAAQLREIEVLIEEHYDEITNAWRKHFGG